MRRAIPIAVVAGLLVPVALAAGGKPQEKFTKAGQARARAAALKAADVGAAWKPQKRSASDDQSNPRCPYYDPDQSDLVEIGKYTSPNFSRSDGSFVSSSTGVFKTARMARAAYARVAVPAVARCFGDLFKKAIAKPNVAAIASIRTLSMPRYGDRSNAYRISASLKTPTASVPFAIDLVLFNRGQIDVAMIFLGIGRPLPASFERALVGRVAARAR